MMVMEEAEEENLRNQNRGSFGFWNIMVRLGLKRWESVKVEVNYLSRQWTIAFGPWIGISWLFDGRLGLHHVHVGQLDIVWMVVIFLQRWFFLNFHPLPFKFIKIIMLIEEIKGRVICLDSYFDLIWLLWFDMIWKNLNIYNDIRIACVI